MFKKYLRVQPAAVQLIIFLTFWFVLMTLSTYLSQIYIVSSAHISASQLPVFVEQDMFKHPNLVFVSNSLFQIFAFLLPAVVYAYLADPRPVQYLGGISARKKIHPFLVFVIALGLIFIISPLGQWLRQLDLGSASKAIDEQHERMILAYLSSADTWSMIRSVILIAIIPACCEEIFFRGLLMKFAQTVFKRWWLSIGISALVFAAFHNTISEFVPIFVAGIVLGYVYYLTSSIWMNILLHLLFNGLQVIAGMSSNPQVEKSLGQTGTLIGIFSVAVIVVGFCLMMLYRVRTPLPAYWSVVVPEVKEQDWDMDNDRP